MNCHGVWVLPAPAPRERFVNKVVATKEQKPPRGGTLSDLPYTSKRAALVDRRMRRPGAVDPESEDAAGMNFTVTFLKWVRRSAPGTSALERDRLRCARLSAPKT